MWGMDPNVNLYLLAFQLVAPFLRDWLANPDNKTVKDMNYSAKAALITLLDAVNKPNGAKEKAQKVAEQEVKKLQDEH